MVLSGHLGFFFFPFDVMRLVAVASLAHIAQRPHSPGEARARTPAPQPWSRTSLPSLYIILMYYYPVLFSINPAGEDVTGNYLLRITYLM